MSEKIPFFINSNIVTSLENVKDFSSFMNAISYNTGNSYITYSLIKECFNDIKSLHHIQNIYNYDFDNQEKDIDFINNVATHVVFVLQDQIRIHESYGLKLPYEKIKNFIKKINKPLIIAGLGANYFTSYNKDFYKMLSAELADFLQFLSEHCIKIGVRGYFTQEILSKLGIKNVQVIGCPSYFETGKNRIITKPNIKDIKEVVLSSNLPISNVENNFQIMQDFYEEKIINAICYNKFESEFSSFELKKLKNFKYRIFSNIEDWKIFMKQFKFAIGFRLHGTILAINSGIPAMCCNGDARATEMCAFFGIPHYKNLSENTNIMELYENIDISSINRNYKYLYENFENFLKTNNIEISENSNLENNLECPTLELYNKNYTKCLWFYIIKKIFKDYCNLIYNKYTIVSNYLKVFFNKIKNLAIAIKDVLKFKIKSF